MSETDNSTASTIKKLARDTAGQVAVHTDNALWRVAEHIPVLNLLVARRERTLARTECAVMLQICRKLQAENPVLSGEALYEAAVGQRLLCDETRARQMVRLADQSFAQWPEERDVNLRDVVNYVIVHQIMSAHTRTMGVLIDMEAVVASEIPEGI